MQTIELFVNNYPTKEDLFSFLQKERLGNGDKVMIKPGLRTGNRFSLEAVITMALLMILTVLRETNKKNKPQMTLESILDEHLDINGLEKKIGEEYGVRVEIEPLNQSLGEKNKMPGKFKISSLKGKISKMSSGEIDRQMLKIRSEWERDI
jgi:hypothetical protein